MTDPASWMGIGISLVLLVGIPVLLLKAVDLGRALRDKPHPSRVESAAGLLLMVLQAVLALLAVGIGAAILGWIVYGLPSHSGPGLLQRLQGLFTGILITLVGLLWLRQVFSRSRNRNQEHQERP